MSEIEFERADQEAMDLVNRTASPDATEAAEQIAQDLGKAGAVKVMTAEELEAEKRECDAIRSYRRRLTRDLVFRLIASVIVAAALLVAMFVPEAVVWVVNIGVLIAGIVAALAIDRYLRWR